MEVLAYIENDDVLRLQRSLHNDSYINEDSLLIYACNEKAYDCVRYLICHGANPYKKNHDGLSAYKYALEDATIMEGIKLFMPRKKYPFWGKRWIKNYENV